MFNIWNVLSAEAALCKVTEQKRRHQQLCTDQALMHTILSSQFSAIHVVFVHLLASYAALLWEELFFRYSAAKVKKH